MTGGHPHPVPVLRERHVLPVPPTTARRPGPARRCPTSSAASSQALRRRQDDRPGRPAPARSAPRRTSACPRGRGPYARSATRRPGSPKSATRGDGANRPGRPGAVMLGGHGQQVRVDRRRRRDTGLLGHGDELRAGHHQGGHAGRTRQPRPPRPGRAGAAATAPGSPRARIAGQHRGLLVDQHRGAQHHAEDQRLAAAWARRSRTAASSAAAGTRAPGRDVQVGPVLLGEHRGQAEERPGRDRAGLRAQPQPGRPVHRVAEQARQHDREQAERDARARRPG